MAFALMRYNNILKIASFPFTTYLKIISFIGRYLLLSVEGHKIVETSTLGEELVLQLEAFFKIHQLMFVVVSTFLNN